MESRQTSVLARVVEECAYVRSSGRGGKGLCLRETCEVGAHGGGRRR